MTILFAYPTARLSLVLPAQATDEHLTFAESWRVSSGNGWRLAVILLTVPLAFVREFMMDAASAGLHVELFVLKANRRAQALYSRLGFVEQEDLPNHFRMRWPASTEPRLR